MAGITVGARMSPRELGIIAYMMDIEKPSTAEIVKYAYRLRLGYTNGEARQSILDERTSAASQETEDRMITVRLPEELVNAALASVADVGTEVAIRHRYIMALATTSDEKEALALATRNKRGRPRKDGKAQS